MEDNTLCEICQTNGDVSAPNIRQPTGWYYWINTHCIELRRNREARDNKNYNVKLTVF